MKRKICAKKIIEEEGDENPKRTKGKGKSYVVIPLADAKRRLLEHLGLA